MGCFLSQRSFFLCVLKLLEDDVKLATREGGDDAVHEAEELDTAAALGMRRDDPAGGDFERCEQGRGAVPLVVGGSAWSGRARSAASNSLAHAPMLGSKAFRRHREQSP